MAKQHWTWRETLITVIAILIGVAIVGAVLISVQAPEVSLRTGVYGYCLIEPKSSDCDAWRNQALEAHRGVIQACQVSYPYPDNRAAFFACLKAKGV